MPLKILLFLKNNLKTKKPFSKGQRARKVRLPLLDSFRTFKGNMTIENIRLNQLVFQ